MATQTAGESMTADSRARVAAAFGRPVHDVYGATEFEMMAVDCPSGWLHVNSDWVVLEPVDEAMRPTPTGQLSHTVLLTNLADRIQPIIRYDLGDSVVARPDPCPCGSPFPAIQVEGRRDDVLRLVARDGRTVAVLQLAIGAALESAQGVRRGQLIQTGPSAIRLRLEPEPGTRTEQVWAAVLGNLHGGQRCHGLARGQPSHRRSGSGRGHGPHAEPLDDPATAESVLLSRRISDGPAGRNADLHPGLHAPDQGHVHIDPVHFGLVVVLNLMIGLLTPPVGYLLFMSAEMAGVSIDAVVREVTPLLIALLAVLAISTYWPGMVMAIPHLFQSVR